MDRGRTLLIRRPMTGVVHTSRRALPLRPPTVGYRFVIVLFTVGSVPGEVKFRLPIV
jgi:hypothetical protein